MLNSNNRMEYIIEYLSAYKDKINIANKQGLFDSAKLFELFASEICNLWFGQPFENLNVETATFPYVDLISADKKIFVQVSTTKDIPNKIKDTLTKIRDSKNQERTPKGKIIFFVLSNESENKIKDFTGDEQIGQISFTVKDNLITTNMVINKAQNDLVFQEQLYILLKTEFENFNELVYKFNECLDYSKNVGMNNIIGLINDEYEIERSALLKTIRSDDSKFFSIQGEAGSGKSALCKKYLEDEDLFLYTRAEKIATSNSVDDIWNIKLTKLFDYLNGKRIVLFIDALEFVADCKDMHFEILQHVYEIAKKYKNVYVLTSCRTSEKSKFIRLESILSIRTYVVDELTEAELKPIMDKYPLIKQMYTMNSYNPLLRSPFYINLIVKNVKDINDIKDEVSFRNYIWNNIICLKEEAAKYNIKHSDVIATIEKIVFERAQNFLLGISKDYIDSDMLKMLVSEGVVSEQEDRIRLKYDIFEDICFEHHFDLKFDGCRGAYNLFYEGIDKLGRCAYRRYQIWIANKLFMRSNRNKFIYCLIFSDVIPLNWRKQTEIGIVKSRYCTDFFEEHGTSIVEQNLLLEFISIVNLYAFEAKIKYSENQIPKISLFPIGNGRASLIKIIFKMELYKDNGIETDNLIKLCSDYSKQTAEKNEVTMVACTMLTYLVDCVLEKFSREKNYKFDIISPYLKVIYQLSESSNEWIKSFWSNLIISYSTEGYPQKQFSKKAIIWTLENAYHSLFPTLTTELCELADLLWSQPIDEKKGRYSYESETYQQFGLSENAGLYNYSHNSVYINPFLYNLFLKDFQKGLKWAINFINKATLKYVENCPEDVISIKLKFVDTSETHEYWGNPNMWLAGVQYNFVPTLIGDIIFVIKDVLVDTIETFKNDYTVISSFLSWLKDLIYKKSNNVMLLTIISNIGLYFEKSMPGYALDLATNLYIIHWDFHRKMKFTKDPTLKLLEKQIYSSIGLPEIKDRYDSKLNNNIDIQNYVINNQLYYGDSIQKKCCLIIDHLYSITKNDDENAHDYLQIQKMDLREAEVTLIKEDVVALTPKITGEAAKIVETSKKAKAPTDELHKEITEKIKKSTKDNLDLKGLLEAIHLVQKLMKDPYGAVQYENLLITLIAHSFKCPELKCEERSQLCEIWIDGVNRIFSSGSFVSNVPCCILFDQLTSNISQATKNKLKCLILKCILYIGDNGLIHDIANEAKDYLYNNTKLSRAVFNTIIKLAEDEMNRQKYNVECLRSIKKESFEFIPNMQSPHKYADRYITSNGLQCYCNHKDEIIKNYLLEEEKIDTYDFSIDNYDVSILCHIANCGLSFKDSDFRKFIHEIILCIVNIWDFNKEENHIEDILNVYCKDELVQLYRKQMIRADETAQIAIDTLFDNMDFSKFNHHSVDFYLEVLGNFLPEFYDAHIIKDRRTSCKKKILCLEKKITEIDDEYVKVQLYKSLILSVTIYCHSDWSKIRTSYSYEDKQFLNQQFSKYGKYHLKDMLYTIKKLKIDELLPEILVSISNCFEYAKEDHNKFKETVKERWEIICTIILSAFVNHSDQIKGDKELIDAYENILSILADLNYEEAAVVLDEFRIH